MLKDLSVTQLAIKAELDLDLTYGEPALVYINDQFHGLLNLRTEANTNGMASLYDVKKKEVTLAKITTHALIKKDGDFDRIDRFVEAIECLQICDVFFAGTGGQHHGNRVAGHHADHDENDHSDAEQGHASGQ